MINSSNKSLKFFIRNAFLIIGILVSFIAGNVILKVYYHGLNETAEFYLVDDGYDLINIVDNGFKWPSNNSFKYYYEGINQLPNKYKLPTNLEHLSIHHFDLPEYFDFLLVLKPQEWNAPKFIVHSFKKSAESKIYNLTIHQLIVLVLIIFTMILMLMGWFIYRSFSKSVYDLYDWVVQNRNVDNLYKKATKYKTKGKSYIEIQSIADQINHYVDTIEGNKIKEREFIRKLSHELRTPLAITKAALDILEKDPSVSKKIYMKFKKIRIANDEMIQTSSAILGLWQEDYEESIKESILIRRIVLETIKDHQLIIKRTDLSFCVNIDKKATIIASRKILKILINNLISNVFHHSSSGEVTISYTRDTLALTNNIDHNNDVDVSNWLTKNHGIGLSVINTICENYNWSVHSSINTDTYCIEIKNIVHLYN